MSADNWAKCPRCLALGEKKFAEREVAIQKSYGVVPVEEFDEARRALAADRTNFETGGYTFREDYEIYGAETGEITVSYGGHCQKCGLGFDFEEIRQIPGVDK